MGTGIGTLFSVYPYKTKFVFVHRIHVFERKRRILFDCGHVWSSRCSSVFRNSNEIQLRRIHHPCRNQIDVAWRGRLSSVCPRNDEMCVVGGPKHFDGESQRAKWDGVSKIYEFDSISSVDGLSIFIFCHLTYLLTYLLRWIIRQH